MENANTILKRANDILDKALEQKKLNQEILESIGPSLIKAVVSVLSSMA